MPKPPSPQPRRGWAMTDPKLEQEARELLATACGERVEDMLYDRPGFVAKDQAIRAIVAALSQQRAVPEVIESGCQIVEEFIQCSQVGRPPGKLVEQAKDWLAAAKKEAGNG